MPIKVIKLGGSLMSDATALTQCLNTVEQYKEKVVIVPGGGVFADQVRFIQKKWEFDDKIAHQMAILAMKQMALLFKSIKPVFMLAETISSIHQTFNNHSAVIWSPNVTVLNGSAIEANWDVTSDSLAAWLAGQLNAKELVVVKSAEISQNLPLQKMQDQGLVDKAFIDFTKNAAYNITLINKYQFNEYFIS